MSSWRAGANFLLWGRRLYGAPCTSRRAEAAPSGAHYYSAGRYFRCWPFCAALAEAVRCERSLLLLMEVEWPVSCGDARPIGDRLPRPLCVIVVLYVVTMFKHDASCSQSAACASLPPGGCRHGQGQPGGVRGFLAPAPVRAAPSPVKIRRFFRRDRGRSSPQISSTAPGRGAVPEKFLPFHDPQNAILPAVSMHSHGCTANTSTATLESRMAWGSNWNP